MPKKRVIATIPALVGHPIMHDGVWYNATSPLGVLDPQPTPERAHRMAQFSSFTVLYEDVDAAPDSPPVASEPEVLESPLEEEAPAVDHPDSEEIESMSYHEIKSLASSMGIKTHGMKKADLIAAVKGGTEK